MPMRRNSTGPNVACFETGQGSELSRHIMGGIRSRWRQGATDLQKNITRPVKHGSRPLSVRNTLHSKQAIRAELEDHYGEKLSGISTAVTPAIPIIRKGIR